MYKWQQVKVLGENGASIKEIARRLKLSRNTVRKYLRRDSIVDPQKWGSKL